MICPRRVSRARITPPAPTAASYQRNGEGPRIMRVETKMQRAIATRKSWLMKKATEEYGKVPRT